MKRIRIAILVATVNSIVPLATAHAQLIDDTFTYQGQLKLNGQVINGSADMAFYLWDAQTGGNMMGLPTAQVAIPITDGKFTVDLNFSAPDLTGNQRWLEIAVRYPAGSGSYTFLNPRQPLRATPYSVTALTALSVSGMDGHSLNAADGSPVDALYADNAGNIGIGTTTPHSGFKLQLTGGAGAWKGGIAAGGVTSAAVMGELSGVATIGGHNAALSAWSDLSINPAGGNVGIGTSTPAGKLHVNGDIRGSWMAVGYAGSPVNQGLYIDDDHIDTVVGAPLLIQSNSLGPVNIAGNLGVGTSSPTNKLTVVGNGDFTGNLGIGTATPSNKLSVVGNGNVTGNLGIGTTTPATKLHVTGGTDIALASGGNIVSGVTNGLNIGMDDNEIMARNNGAASTLYLNNDGGNVTIAPNGTTTVRVLEILGADVAERFPSNDEIKPGMVVMIDTANPGKLCLARGRYNKQVAGIASGANGLPAGTILGNLPGNEKAAPIALTGRVWCWCDADEGGAIEAGDMLTTSDTLGHAMKCADRDRAYGAVIGKAMTSLKSGKGLVLVLVNLQ